MKMLESLLHLSKDFLCPNRKELIGNPGSDSYNDLYNTVKSYEKLVNKFPQNNHLDLTLEDYVNLQKNCIK